MRKMKKKKTKLKEKTEIENKQTKNLEMKTEQI